MPCSLHSASRARFVRVAAPAPSLTADDFPKPSDRRTDEPTYKILERWTRTYFDSDASQTGSTHDAFQELMRPAVRVGTKLPFILQVWRSLFGTRLTGSTLATPAPSSDTSSLARTSTCLSTTLPSE